MTRVSVIGLGRMGRGIARRLSSRGYEVFGYDVMTSAYSYLKDLQNFKSLSSPADASESDFVLLSLPGGSELLAILPQLKGLEGVAINLTTIGLEESRKAKSLAEDLGLKYITAMMEGGPTNAEAGTLVLYVGGNRGLYEASKQVLSDMGQHIYVGSDESAVALKLISTLILMANTVVLAEAASALKNLGAPPDDIVKALSMGGADSAQLRSRLPLMLKGSYKELFSIELGSYVAEEALKALKELGSTFTPVLAEVSEVLAAAKQRGLGKSDISEVEELYRLLSLK
ncbi:6-Phosphogluconate dehydrogenase [Acidilobus saccharovorans 345-15]|uniref:6-Phosphogluconate dehydrogenase n=1 Tax=Acidilobus saccharovorans (strain DSM 16705 / JCM 18335 / VKM B-2471 / 345-15) TaxID=666510 RepID=D9Q210_ACIS3|nr:NAD(P)-dependent oxidoreductase [Acidilobus saccharovorans]ADL19348.1 6-Phosphogluconate dehydrogenase [Acidilobus saccharovorans 345-15]